MSDPTLKGLIANTLNGFYPKSKVQIWIALASGIFWGTIATQKDLIAFGANDKHESVGDYLVQLENIP